MRKGNKLPHFWHSWQDLLHLWYSWQDLKINKAKNNFMRNKNKDIRGWVAGTKTTNVLADAFRLAHHNLLKLKKYEGVGYNEDQSIAEINEIIDSTSNIKVNDFLKTLYRDPQNKIIKIYTLWGNCWKHGRSGHSAKKCQNNSIMAPQDQTYEGQTTIHVTDPIR